MSSAIFGIMGSSGCCQSGRLRLKQPSTDHEQIAFAHMSKKRINGDYHGNSNKLTSRIGADRLDVKMTVLCKLDERGPCHRTQGYHHVTIVPYCFIYRIKWARAIAVMDQVLRVSIGRKTEPSTVLDTVTNEMFLRVFEDDRILVSVYKPDKQMLISVRAASIRVGNACVFAYFRS